MSLGDLIRWVKGSAAEGITTFVLRNDQVEDEDVAGPTGFAPGQVYLEIRVRQVWLTQERELWREYQPFGAVVTEFLYQGKPIAIPTVLGSSELRQKMQVLGEDDAIQISNIRVAGPLPYEGDDVSLLLALFRTKTVDWLARSLRVIEDVSKAIGVGGLPMMVPVAESIVRAVTEFLGVRELELRVGEYRSWPATELQPMHYVVMRRSVGSMTTEERNSLRVKDGRLHRSVHVDGQAGLRPYTEHDFMLVSIRALKFRDDYKRLDFYQLWQQTQTFLMDREFSAAERTWRKTQGALYTDELIPSQQHLLTKEYKARYESLLAQFGPITDYRSAPTGELPAFERPRLDVEDPGELLRRMTGAAR